MCPQVPCMWKCIITLIAFVWLFSTMCIQMGLQITRMKGCKAAFLAFVWFFSHVFFQMSLQIAWPRRHIVALIAFIGFVATVRFQMFSQTYFMIGCIITFCTLVWFFSTVDFQMHLQITCIGQLLSIKENICPDRHTHYSEVQNQNVFTQVKLLNTKKTRMSKKDFEETKNRFSMDGGLKCQSLNFQFTCISWAEVKRSSNKCGDVILQIIATHSGSWSRSM